MSSAARSLTIFFTHLTPVGGNVQAGNNLTLPLIGMHHRYDDILCTGYKVHSATHSFTILPGIFQLAISPVSLTSMAPRTVRSTLPALIIPKLNAESKTLSREQWLWFACLH